MRRRKHDPKPSDALPRSASWHDTRDDLLRHPQKVWGAVASGHLPCSGHASAPPLLCQQRKDQRHRLRNVCKFVGARELFSQPCNDQWATNPLAAAFAQKVSLVGQALSLWGNTSHSLRLSGLMTPHNAPLRGLDRVWHCTRYPKMLKYFVLFFFVNGGFTRNSHFLTTGGINLHRFHRCSGAVLSARYLFGGEI